MKHNNIEGHYIATGNPNIVTNEPIYIITSPKPNIKPLNTVPILTHSPKPTLVPLPTVPTVPTKPTLVPLPTVTTVPTKPTLVPLPPVTTVPTKPTLVPLPTVPTVPTKPTLAPLPTVPTVPTKPTLVPLPTVPTVPTKPTLVPLPTVTRVPTAPTLAPLPTVTRVPTAPTQLLSPLLPPLVVTGNKRILPTVPRTNKEVLNLPGMKGFTTNNLVPINIPTDYDPINKRQMILRELVDILSRPAIEPITRRGYKDKIPVKRNTYIRDINYADIERVMDMMTKSVDYIRRYISKVYGNLNGTKDDLISLYWWGVIYLNVHNIRTPEQMDIISTLSNKELQELLPENWVYPRDNGSILFRLVTDYYPPPLDATKEPRYESILVTHPDIIVKLAISVYNYYGIEDRKSYEFYSHYSPYRHVALQNPSIMEPYVLNYNAENLDNIVMGLGMNIPPNIINREEYYFDNLRYYEKILTRDSSKLMPVPDLTHVTANRIPTMLETYTDQELILGYELGIPETGLKYNGRMDLIKKISDDRSRTMNKWWFRDRNCENEDRYNIMELDRRENNPENPIISYGTYARYRCWNMDELVATWSPDDEGNISFSVPDWVRGDPYKTFPVESIKQLKEAITYRHKYLPQFQNFINIINNGLQAMYNAAIRLKTYKNFFDQLSQEQKDLIKEYLSWMFITSMYMRFWKGPGYPYPTVWIEGGRNINRCNTNVRSINITSQYALRKNLLTRLPEDLKKWLLSFPRVEYNFKEGTAGVGMESINYIVEKAEKGQFCLAEASDHLMFTSYYLFQMLFGVDVNSFNQIIRDYIRNPDQTLFDPYEVTETRHRDPEYILEKIIRK
jgi:hypothetical protein